MPGFDGVKNEFTAILCTDGSGHACYLSAMPQTRIVLDRTDALMVERVVSPATPVRWSPIYEVPTMRVVLAASGAATEFRAAGETVLLDGLTLLCLPTQMAYQMRPCSGAARVSLVISVRQQAGIQSQHQTLQRQWGWLKNPSQPEAHAPPDAYILAPQSLLALRRHWRMLARGDVAGAGAVAVAAVPGKPPRASRAQPTQDLLQRVLQSALRPAHAPKRPVAVQRAQRFMVTGVNAADGMPWTLHDVADAACCSLFHLSRLFRRHLGTGLHGYRQRLRLATALQRLEDGERNLAALAHDLGFAGQSHLGSVFLREIGITPAQARRELGS
jgi:AraC-like DNA-binding protein